jgi:hypothetical protein
MIDSAFSRVDIYATKGLEYLIAALFFICLIAFVKYFVYYKPERKIKIAWPDENKDVQSRDNKI